MQVIKYIILTFIFIFSNIIGKMIAQKYRYRKDELEEMYNALNIFKTKIRFTYSTIGEVFEEIRRKHKQTKHIKNIFTSKRKYAKAQC